jgi:branched-chain amino acid transport system ATP-binding protein
MKTAAKTVLRVEGLTVRYGAVTAVREATLAIAEGEVVAIIGPNGAGKTSLLAAVAGGAPRASGRVEICGRSTADVERSDFARLGVALVPEGRHIFANLTVLENLRLGASIRRDTEIDSDLAAVFGDFPVLAERRNQTAGLLSGGEQQMLAISRALMSRPRLLVLDEPSLGLAPLVVGRVYETLNAVRMRGVAILIAEQNAPRAFAIADHAFIMSHGRFALSGRPHEIRAREDFDGAYFGVAMSGASPG